MQAVPVGAWAQADSADWLHARPGGPCMGVHENPGLEHAANPIHLGWHGARITTALCIKLTVRSEWRAKASQTDMEYHEMVS